MPDYMLLLYGSESAAGDGDTQRWSEISLWDQVNASLEKAGVLVAHAPLHSTESATTVRVRGDETELSDGPFAVTKEVLAGYYVLACADLDEAIRHASRLPWARYGSVEVRPIMANEEIPRFESELGTS